MKKDKEQFYFKIKPSIDLSVRTLCKKSYPLHKKGCPNYNIKDGCPPNCKTINELINLNSTVYIIFNKFNFEEHVKRMKKLHPEWSKRQTECCLYWQGRARKYLKEKIKEFKKEFPDYYILNSPEANGVNLTETMKKIGINLEWPPKKYTYQIVLAGKRK